MKFTRQNKFTAHVEASSMNDIMFFLLLFFLIVSTLVNPSVVKLTLPKPKNKVAEMNKQQITIDVTKDKEYYLNGDAKGHPTPPDQLENVLRGRVNNLIQAGFPNPIIVLRFDKSLTVQDLVDVLAIGSDLKVKMILATQPGGK